MAVLSEDCFASSFSFCLFTVLQSGVKMKYKKLGNSDIKVSEICLGSMTWGTQNTQSEGHAQIDRALERGVNFIDTAEMYPVNPITAETAGRTEEIIGTWLKNGTHRDKVIIATKIVGRGSNTVRDGAGVSRKTIQTAVEGSLKRLQTDYIDLYQIHWPNRNSYHFRQSWHFNPTKQNAAETRNYIHEALETFQRLIEAGKIRTIGLSNESCWGTSQFLETARANNFPRVVSIQNEYSLLDRKYDLDLAELTANEKVGLLAFSPLAAGILSGKYQGDKTPPGSRREFSKDLGGRYTAQVIPVVDQYLEVAKKHGLNCCQMAIAFCLSRPFMTSAIIGATNMRQLDICLDSAGMSLSREVLDDIAEIHRTSPNPMG